MIVSNGYFLNYNARKNEIVIGLPQTMSTLTNTFDEVQDRRVDVVETDLACLLQIVQVIFTKGEQTNEHTN